MIPMVARRQRLTEHTNFKEPPKLPPWVVAMTIVILALMWVLG